MKKIILSFLTLFLTFPAIAAEEYVTMDTIIKWPSNSVITAVGNSSIKESEKQILLGKVISTNLNFSLADFTMMCIKSFQDLYKEKYEANKLSYGKTCYDMANLLINEYNNIATESNKPCIFKLNPQDFQNIEKNARAKETDMLNKGGTPAVADSIYKTTHFAELNSMIPKYCGQGVKGEIGIDPKTKQQTVVCGNCLLKK